MRPIRIVCVLFRDSADTDRSRQALTAFMLGLSIANKTWYETYPATPSLYNSKIVYRAEMKSEDWLDAPSLLARGYGDCEDLACMRIGELQAKGVKALPFITWRRIPGRRGSLLHALVRWPDGRIEDPSRARGMGGGPILNIPVFIGVATEPLSLSGEF